MANLKIDLQNKLRNDKYYDELELVRLAGDPNMNYKDKIDNMAYRLREISLLDAQLALSEQYFQDAQQPDPNEGKQQEQHQPQQVNHQGQTHGE